MMRLWLVLQKHWEYDDNFYSFIGHDGLCAVCLTEEQAKARVRTETARFVRETYGVHSFEEWAVTSGAALDRDAREVIVDEMMTNADDDAVCAFAAGINLAPFTLQAVDVTPAFLHAAGLSPGKRTAILRELGAKLASVAPTAADHLVSHEE